MNNTTTTAAAAAELNAYIAAENAAIEARCIAEGAKFWATFAFTAEELANYGVYTVEQLKEWRAENNRLADAKEDRKNSYGW